MNTHAIEELEVTRSEKALAAVLAVFVLVLLVWAYVELERRPAPVEPTPAEQTAIDAYATAQERLGAAQEGERQAYESLELARERYRTALDAGQPAPALEREYTGAEDAFSAADRAVYAANGAVAATRPAAEAAHQRIAGESEARVRGASRTTFALRLLLVLAAVGLAQLAVLRLRDSRLQPLAIAAVGAAAILALVMGGDYVTDYVDWTSGGPLVLALAGIALTVLAFIALQRFLARRLPLRRARKRECPACGYPVRGTPHCEGCGRAVAEPCAGCDAPRRLGTPRCGTCGAA